VASARHPAPAVAESLSKNAAFKCGTAQGWLRVKALIIKLMTENERRRGAAASCAATTKRPEIAVKVPSFGIDF
jgi:hypothetical protein